MEYAWLSLETFNKCKGCNPCIFMIYYYHSYLVLVILRRLILSFAPQRSLLTLESLSYAVKQQVFYCCILLLELRTFSQCRIQDLLTNSKIFRSDFQ